MLKLLIFDKGSEGQFLETTTHREGTHSGQVDSLLVDIDSLGDVEDSELFDRAS